MTTILNEYVAMKAKGKKLDVIVLRYSLIKSLKKINIILIRYILLGNNLFLLILSKTNSKTPNIN